MGNRTKMKENEKINKYLDLAYELIKKNMNMTMIPSVVSVRGTVTKGSEKDSWENSGKIETIETTAVLKLPRILR